MVLCAFAFAFGAAASASPAAGQDEPGPGEAIPYFIDNGTGIPGYQPADDELARGGVRSLGAGERGDGCGSWKPLARGGAHPRGLD